ncbi:hypothetical protein RJ639_015035 [Escallonia herrerae]|uniref:Leucine-rich repeat-containing N-terminal plant-type domain-containing protein n=1 Tax=Escallonia herrerae TaxID=1293975 RepID=A0AA88VGF9_9ASTE|nr:hypothetical protein RJ639_015035 [Escallonia herrerae]
MAHNRRYPTPVTHALVFILLCTCSERTNGRSSDIGCLESIFNSLQDPLQLLRSSWDFSNGTEGFICRFAEVECWHPDESRVLNLRLSGMGLKGRFPRGLEMCSTLTGLDLSENALFRAIPSDISELIPYVTYLDLLYNNISGEIPISIGNLSFLNVLKLENNRLEGHIPQEVGLLGWIRTFNVANNRLSGPVTTFSADVPIAAENYTKNLGLCGYPLKRCKRNTDYHDSFVRGMLCRPAVSPPSRRLRPAVSPSHRAPPSPSLTQSFTSSADTDKIMSSNEISSSPIAPSPVQTPRATLEDQISHPSTPNTSMGVSGSEPIDLESGPDELNNDNLKSAVWTHFERKKMVET